MTLSPIESEIAAELSRIQRGEDMIPFLARLIPVEQASFRPLPDDMLEIIRTSTDFRSICPGEVSTWLQLETDDDAAAIVIYRAGDGSYHILAPDS